MATERETTSRQPDDDDDTHAARNPHPLANDLTEQEIARGSPDTEEMKRRQENESLRHKVETPTSPPRKRQILYAWVGFLAWTLVTIFVSISVAIVRGSFDWLPATILIAIPFGLFFLFPIWMGYQTKSSQDETARRLG